MNRFYFRTGLAAVLFIALLVLLRSAAQETDSQPKIDPQARRIVHQFAQYVRTLKAFSTEVDTSIKIDREGLKMDATLKQNLSVQQPNKLSLTAESGGPTGPGGFWLVSDGQKSYIYIPALKKYTVQDAGGSLDELAENPLIAGGGMGSFSFLGALLAKDPADKLLEGVTEATYVGTEQLGGVTCHHLKFVQEQFDWELWIEATDRPLVRRVVPDMAKLFRRMGEQLGQAETFEKMKVDTVISFANWNTNPRFTDEDFHFQPPEDAEQVESLFDLSGAEEEGPHPLVGQPAPEFQLANLAGQNVQLASHKNKDVVILDFWATWCGPCRRAMPTIAKVAQQYKDRGVVLYAVNLQEEKDVVQEFITQEKLDVTVLLDQEGTVGQAYHANAIPQTVLIGKDGRVQVVHVGASPELETELVGNLDALLAGKDLAAETSAREEADEAVEPAKPEADEDK